ncbi:MAG: CPBP family intramembrane metalloprotease, partial [Deltaproteobacteria bacterium]|nr:CPBP family intramembrane metalloprotease [Deltaproteobacteria bacterium]
GALVAALAVAAAVFPPYVAAYEGWARLTRGSAMVLPEHALTHFPAELRDRPPLPGVPGVHAWVESERLWVVNTGAEAATLRAEGCACPARGADLEDDGLFHASRPVTCSPDGAGPTRIATRQGLSCPVGAAERVAVRTSDPEVRVLAGAGSVETDPGGGSFDRSWWWIPELLLIQLVVIALPEEVFYRGYVQSRLRPLFATRRRLRLLGAEIGWEVPLASALFAASHLVTIPSPFRLAVFFPGLLFGWMRERTGSVLAPAIFHALCNVLLEVLVRWHG